MEATEVPREMELEFGDALAALRALGYAVDSAEYHAKSFGNWYIDLAGQRSFRVVKDRQQFFIEGDEPSLESFGLSRAFDDLEDLAPVLLRWAASNDLTPSALRPQEVEDLLDRLCVDLGFCLPVAARELIVANPPNTVGEFVRTVFQGEGLDPTADKPLHAEVELMVQQVFSRF